MIHFYDICIDKDKRRNFRGLYCCCLNVQVIMIKVFLGIKYKPDPTMVLICTIDTNHIDNINNESLNIKCFRSSTVMYGYTKCTSFQMYI